MAYPHLICVLQDTGDPILRIDSFDYKLAEGDTFQHTTGGASTTYLVESAVLEMESKVGDPEATSTWTTLVLRVTASIVP